MVREFACQIAACISFLPVMAIDYRCILDENRSDQCQLSQAKFVESCVNYRLANEICRRSAQGRQRLGWLESEPIGVTFCRKDSQRVRRMETSEGRLRGTAENVWKVSKRSRGRAGVVFIEQNDESGPGVKLRDPI